MNGTLLTPYGELDFLTLGKASLAITFPAQLNATFPLIVQPGRSTPGVFYKAALCAPEDVAKCINAGRDAAYSWQKDCLLANSSSSKKII